MSATPSSPPPPPGPPPAYAAYIPCYNNAADIRRAVESVLALQPPPVEVLVVDDGSTDGSPDTLAGLPVTVHRQPQNSGRGPVRALAMERLTAEFVLCLDATNTLPADFAARALAWFADPQVAALFGKITVAQPRGVVDRWRGRHLFREKSRRINPDSAAFITYGAMVRRAAVLAVGNYDRRLRHTEDAELGQRLRAAGWRIVGDGTLPVLAHGKTTLGHTLERYWRWYAGADERLSLVGYLRDIAYSARVLAAEDLRDRDWLRVPISLFSPHYRFWKTAWRKLTKR